MVFGFAVAVWALGRLGQARTTRTGIVHRPKLTCIALPLAALAISFILIIIFYRLLPGQVAWRFQSDGTPDDWVGREILVTLAFILQLFLTFFALAITWGMSWLVSLTGAANETPLMRGVLLLSGNMVGLPQVLLCFATLDIFSYNSYRTHILPLWAFALLVMALGALFTGAYFARAIRRAWLTSR